MTYHLDMSTVVTHAVVCSLHNHIVYLFDTYRMSEGIIKCTTDNVLLQYSHNKWLLFGPFVVSPSVCDCSLHLFVVYISSQLVIIS